MFGDVGHGIILLLFSLYYILREGHYAQNYRKIDESEKNFYSGRYIIALMAVFSIYCGLLYNECFSIPLNLFSSNWRWPAGSVSAVQIDPGSPYIFGVDPAWRGARNELSYYNSMKMKVS